HCRSVKEVCSSFSMFGRATLTTVMSRRSMKTAMQTTMRTRHFRSIPAKLIEKESTTALRKVSRDGAHAVTSASARADGRSRSSHGPGDRLREPEGWRREDDDD